MITIDYFTDLLCVWAYGGQVRLDELRERLGESVLVRERFTSLFADTDTRIGQGWKDRGGFEGFGEHVREICEQWPHTALHSEVWGRCRPATSTNAHLFLRAASLCLGLDEDLVQGEAREQLHQLSIRVRCAFFAEGRDIADMAVLLSLLAQDDPTPEAIRGKIDSGAAAAALHRDEELARGYGVRGSPTYVFNEGRQMLYGNVGYRIIEANIRELLANRSPVGEPSWC